MSKIIQCSTVSTKGPNMTIQTKSILEIHAFRRLPELKSADSFKRVTIPIALLNNCHPSCKVNSGPAELGYALPLQTV